MGSSDNEQLAPDAHAGNGPDWRRSLPALDSVLRQPAASAAIEAYGREAVKALIREQLDALRLGAIPSRESKAEAIAAAAAAEAERRFTLSPGPVINATGVIIHTNLGRAPLSHVAARAIAQVVAGYSALEYELERGTRGSRNALLAPLLCQLTGAEDGVVVNNNAAAVQLALAAIAQGQDVIVSRGQAVEIGGGFRIPTILAQSGARLIEVGTTNRTRLADYQEAITPRTAAMLHVHPSNFRMVGFTESVNIEALVALGARQNIPVIQDLGSGCLLDLRQFGLGAEPLIQDSVKAGADVVCFSGDKLLGGPQSGIIIGHTDFIARIRRHPLMRALRVDKTTIAGLHATLLHFLRGEAVTQVPVWQMIAMPASRIEARARMWLDALVTPKGVRASLEAGLSTIGGGAAPGETLPTTVLCLRPPSNSRGWAAHLSAQMRHGDPPVIGRVEDGAMLLDPRTVLPEQDNLLIRALCAALNG
jgi:L-seryl-tRNA(Ser) seleniumtransferase